MSAIGNINVMVGANSSGLSKGLGKAEGEISGFGSSVMSMLGAGGGLAAGFLGISSAFDALSSGIKGAADMEQAEIGFGVLFKSTETAKAVLGDLSKFAAETPFELPELTSAARSLAAFGFEAGSIVPEMKMLGDIAAGINQPIGELAEIYGKARVQGRLFGEDINQLTGRGIPVTQALAKQFGVAESQVKKLVENGKVGFPELEKAMQSMTAEGGLFSGMMAKQSQSMSGLWSTMNDSIGTALREISGGIMEGLNVKAGIAAFTAGIDTVKGVIMSLGPYATQLVNVWKAEQTLLADGFAIIGEYAGIAFSYVDELSGGALGNMGGYIIDFLSIAEWSFQNVGNLGLLLWQTVELGAVSFYEDMKHLLTVQLPALWSWLSDDWSATWSSMLDYTLTILINLGENIRSAMKEIWDWIKSAGTDSMEFAWKPLTEGAVSAMKALPDIPERAMTEFEKTLSESVNSLGNELGTSLGEHMEKRYQEFLGGGSLPKVAAGVALPTPPPASAGAAKSSSATDVPKLAGGFVKGSLEAASLMAKNEAAPEFKKLVDQNKELIAETKKVSAGIRDLAKAPSRKLVTT